MSKKKKVEKQDVMKFGLDCKGVIRVFAKTRSIEAKNGVFEITDFWTNFSRKNEKDEYVNTPLKVIFQKDLETPENNTLVEVKEGFLAQTGNPGYEQLALIIMDWDDHE